MAFNLQTFQKMMSVVQAATTEAATVAGQWDLAITWVLLPQPCRPPEPSPSPPPPIPNSSRRPPWLPTGNYSDAGDFRLCQPVCQKSSEETLIKSRFEGDGLQAVR